MAWQNSLSKGGSSRFGNCFQGPIIAVYTVFCRLKPHGQSPVLQPLRVTLFSAACFEKKEHLFFLLLKKLVCHYFITTTCYIYSEYFFCFYIFLSGGEEERKLQQFPAKRGTEEYKHKKLTNCYHYECY